jgi:hypothetical protein
MTPQEKARDIYNSYWFCLLESNILDRDYWSKMCSIIAIDELMKAPHENTYMELIPSDAEETDWFWDEYDKYWNEVKEEIQKL